MVGPWGPPQRIQAIANGAIASLPPELPARASAKHGAINMARMTTAMAAWTAGVRLCSAEFAERFFGLAADDPVVQALCGAVVMIGSATNHADFRAAGENVASAMRTTGLDRWPRFLIASLADA